MKIVFFVLILLFGAFQIQAVNWKPIVNVSLPGVDALNPQIGVSQKGYAVAVWQTSDGTNIRIQSAALPFRDSWSAISTLSSAGQDAANPDVAIDFGNDAIAVWERYDGSDWIIQGAAYQQKIWLTPENISAAGQNAHSPQVSVDSDGNGFAIWQRFNGTNTIIQAAFYPKEGSWSAPSDLSISGQNSNSAQIAAGLSEEAVAIWIRSDGSNTIIQTALFSEGSWSGVTNLSDPGQNATLPQIAFNRQGEGIAVWLRSDGSNNIVQASTLSNGTWSSVVNLSAAGQNAFSPQIEINNEGNGIAVWSRFNGDKTVIQGATFLDGTWSSPENLSSGDQNSFVPKLAIDASGNAVAVWRQFSDGNMVIGYAQFFSLNRSWVTYPTLSLPGQNALAPTLASDSDGNVVAVWQRYDGSNFLIQSALGLILSAPPNIRGEQKIIRFLGQGDLMNAVDWDTPDQPGVRFNVYREDLDHLVKSSTEKHFEEHQVHPDEHRTYLITTRDHLNKESDPQAITIP